jgi:hypothetical protein
MHWEGNRGKTVRQEGGVEGLEETYAPDVLAEALNAVAAEDEPDLERAESTPEGEVPVSVVDHSPCVPVRVLT